MEIKSYFAQDASGNIIASPTVSVFLPDTETLATGLKTAAGADLANPFTGGTNGLVQFAAPNGDYDMRVAGPGRSYTLRVQCADLSEYVSEVEALVDIATGAVSGSVNTFYAATKAAAITLAASLGDGATVLVNADESVTPAGAKCRYTVVSGALTSPVLDPMSDISDAAKGAALVAFRRKTLSADIADVAAMFSTQIVNVWEYVDQIVSKPDPADWSTWDWKPAIDAALNASKSVYIPQRSASLSYKTSAIDISRGEGVLVTEPGQAVQVIGVANGAAGVTLSGDSAVLRGGIWTVSNANANIIATTGFRNRLDNVKAGAGAEGGCQRALVVSGLETIVTFGRYRSGAVAGIAIGAFDCYIQNAYLESNRVGLRSDGVGSITGHHIHAFSNSKNGFYLSGASFSQFVSCYADTNGENGWEIRDTSEGLSLVDCWGYKSSNAAANFFDFAFYGAKRVRALGIYSSGDGAFTKAGSVRINTDSQVDFVGCSASGALQADEMNIAVQQSTFSGCRGSLARFNRPPGSSGRAAITVAGSGGTTAMQVKVPIQISYYTSPGNFLFELKLLGRVTSGSGSSLIARYDVSVGFGGTSSAATALYSSNLTASGFSITDNGDGTAQLAFTVTNNNANSAQVAAYVQCHGTSRGYAV